jgi:3-phytase
MALIVLLIVASLAVFLIPAPESVAETALNAVVPQRETPPLFDDEAEGNADADDPAIWLHPQHPHLSLVIGTKKDGGLGVYALGGHEVQAILAPPTPSPEDAPGRFNSVDIAYGV